MASNRTRLILKTAAVTLAGAGLLAAAAGWIVLKSGWYHIGATNQHWQPIHTILEQGMHESVRYHARDVVVPRLGEAAQLRRGAGLYKENCARCHGGPGTAQEDFGKSMQPVPGPLVDAWQHWKPAELYWITRNGIKMSGMPAWEYHLSEPDLWAVVAFMQELPRLSTPAYTALTAGPRPDDEPRAPATPAAGNVERGRIALTQYACNACHMIPGVTGSDVYVGRPLDGIAQRRFIAGHLPNTQENLVRWIRDPKSVDPQTTMPTQGVTERDAVDISAYLLSRR